MRTTLVLLASTLVTGVLASAAIALRPDSATAPSYPLPRSILRSNALGGNLSQAQRRTSEFSDFVTSTPVQQALPLGTPHTSTATAAATLTRSIRRSNALGGNLSQAQRRT